MDPNKYTPLGEYLINDEVRDIIYKNGMKETYPAKRILFYPGDTAEYLYYIDSGKVLMGLWGEDGEERLVEILGSNTFFASASVIGNLPDRIFVSTDTPTTVYKIDRKSTYKLISESEAFRNAILHYISAIVVKLIVLIEDNAFHDCRKRILNLLMATIEKDKLIDGKWAELKYNYSQTDIARIVGATRPTISRMMKELCDDGSIRIINRKIQVAIK